MTFTPTTLEGGAGRNTLGLLSPSWAPEQVTLGVRRVSRRWHNCDVTREPIDQEAPTRSSSTFPGITSDAVRDDGWTPQRRRVRRWLVERAPNLAPVYEATIRLAMDATFPGRLWLMAHALRDMRNRLPNAIAGPVKGSNTQYSVLVARVTKCWMEDGLPGDGSSPATAGREASPEGPARLEVSATLIAAVGELVSGHLAIEPRKRESARRLWAAIGGQPPPDYAVRTWLDATNRAERFAHLREKPLTPEDEEEFEQIFGACERALIAVANKSYENMDEIDAILGSANR
jgi:hypothetical protein